MVPRPDAVGGEDAMVVHSRHARAAPSAVVSSARFRGGVETHGLSGVKRNQMNSVASCSQAGVMRGKGKWRSRLLKSDRMQAIVLGPMKQAFIVHVSHLGGL